MYDLGLPRSQNEDKGHNHPLTFSVPKRNTDRSNWCSECTRTKTDSESDDHDSGSLDLACYFYISTHTDNNWEIFRYSFVIV